MEDQQYIQLQQEYLTAQLQVTATERNYLRQLELNKNQAVSDKVMQQAETDYQTWRITYKALEEKLHLLKVDPRTVSAENLRSSISITAPFDAAVGGILGNTGKYIAPGETIVELYQLSGRLLQMQAFEKDLPLLKEGQRLSYHVPGLPPAEAIIRSIGKTIEDDGSVMVIAQPVAGSNNLVHGMHFSAQVETTRHTATVLPTASIVNYEDKNYIFEQTETNSFYMQEVEIGTTSQEITEIKKPNLSPTQKIVNQGAYSLLAAFKNKAGE